MTKKNLFLFIFLLSSITINAQKKTTQVSRYVDIEAKNDLVYALSTTDKLVVWNMKKGSIEYIKKNIACIHIDKNNIVYYSTNEGEIHKENNLNQWKKVAAFTGTPYAIFATSTNKVASLSSRGIKYNNTYHMPSEKNRFGNGMYSFRNNKLREPQLTYIDNQDRIWLSYDFGKFSEVFIFDTKKSEFIKYKPLLIKDEKKTFNSREDYLKDYQKKQLKKYPYFVKKEGKDYYYKFPIDLPLHYGLKSITQNKEGSYFFSEGLAYSHKKSGLFAYKKTTQNKFYSITEHYESSFKKQNEVFGSLIYNKFNNTLCYYSNYGFYTLTKKDSKLVSELIIDPNILLYNKSITHEYGNLMNVKKIVFLDETKFAFLTKQYGFGYFDGENINLFN